MRDNLKKARKEAGRQYIADGVKDGVSGKYWDLSKVALVQQQYAIKEKSGRMPHRPLKRLFQSK